jgi:hypothetical protein
MLLQTLKGKWRRDLKITQESVIIGPTVSVVVQNMASRDCVKERVKLKRRKRREEVGVTVKAGLHVTLCLQSCMIRCV